MLNHLAKLEVDLQNHYIKKRVSEVELLIHDEFREFGYSGRISNKQNAIDACHDPQPSHLKMKSMDFELKLLSGEYALLTYRCIQWVEEGKPPRYSLRSTIWKKEKSHWQMFFHQGTPTEPFDEKA